MLYKWKIFWFCFWAFDITWHKGRLSVLKITEIIQFKKFVRKLKRNCKPNYYNFFKYKSIIRTLILRKGRIMEEWKRHKFLSFWWGSKQLFPACERLLAQKISHKVNTNLRPFFVTLHIPFMFPYGRIQCFYLIRDACNMKDHENISRKSFWNVSVESLNWRGNA